MPEVEGLKKQGKAFAPLGRYQGLVYAFFSAILMVLVCSLAKDMKQYNTIALSFYTSLFSSSFNFPLLIWNLRSFPKVTKKLIFLWTILALSLLIGQTSRLSAFQMLPIGEASSITFSTPIFTAIFARIILKDRLTWMTLMSLFVSMIGILLIMRIPELITSGDERLGSIQHLLGCCCALGSVFCTAAMFLAMRSLKDVSSPLNTFVNLFGGCILIACVSPAFGGISNPPCDVTIVVKLVSLGVLSLLFTVLLNLALQHDDPTTVGTFYRSTEIMLSFLVQLTFFKESADAYTISGSVLIFACGLSMPLQKWMLGKNEGSVWKGLWLIK